MPLCGHRKKLRLKICPESAPNSLIAPISRSGAYGARIRSNPKANTLSFTLTFELCEGLCQFGVVMVEPVKSAARATFRSLDFH